MGDLAFFLRTFCSVIFHYKLYILFVGERQKRYMFIIANRQKIENLRKLCSFIRKWRLRKVIAEAYILSLKKGFEAP